MPSPKFIHFVPGDRPNPDAGEIIPGVFYAGVVTDGAFTPNVGETHMLDWLKKVASASGTSDVGTSLGVMGPLLALVVMGVNAWFGAEVLPSAEAQEIVDHTAAIFGLITGIIGRIRARKAIGGGTLPPA